MCPHGLRPTVWIAFLWLSLMTEPAGMSLHGTPPLSLGPVPHTCPVGPPATTLPYFGRVWGQGPVWVRSFQRDRRGMLYLGDPLVWRRTSVGWTLKMEWTIKPGFTRPVTVRGGSLHPGHPIKVGIGPIG